MVNLILLHASILLFSASEKYTMPKEEKSVEDKKSSSEKCDVFLLVLYIITLAAMTAVCILSILLY